MKHLLLGLISLVIFSCECTRQSDSSSFDNDAFLSVVESKNIVGDLSVEEYDSAWMSLENRDKVVSAILNAAKKGDKEVFEFFPGELIPMKKSDLDYLFFHYDTVYVENNGDMEPLITEEEFGPSGIVYLKFKEALFFDAENLKFRKKITHVAPMEKVYNDDGTTRGYRGLFWLKL